MLSSFEPVMGAMRQRPWIGPVLGFLLGLIVGLPILGWYVFPVKWVDADVVHLRADLQDDYIRMVAASYAQNRDLELAARRMVGFGDAVGGAFQHAIAQSNATDMQQIADLQIALDQYRQAMGTPTPAASSGNEGGGLASYFLIFLVGLLFLIILAGVGAYVWTRLRQAPTVAVEPGVPLRRPVATTAAPAASAAAPVDMPTLVPAAATGGTVTGQAIARFMTTYTLGDDVYDDSFSVDGPDGSFLGECGMGISETIGVGDPKKVTAFEVWLFDKNDIRTVTKVLMSEHAFRDEALKSRLAAKGEPVSALAGETLSLETATLVVTARIVDMAYGGGALPPNSFFERMTIELQAYRKA